MNECILCAVKRNSTTNYRNETEFARSNQSTDQSINQSTCLSSSSYHHHHSFAVVFLLVGWNVKMFIFLVYMILRFQILEGMHCWQGTIAMSLPTRTSLVPFFSFFFRTIFLSLTRLLVLLLMFFVHE